MYAEPLPIYVFLRCDQFYKLELASQRMQRMIYHKSSLTYFIHDVWLRFNIRIHFRRSNVVYRVFCCEIHLHILDIKIDFLRNIFFKK